MAGRIPDDIIQQVLDRTDIVELIGSYVPLRQAGSRWKGLCPFHSEKTPSFMVNPERQIFHCFGCGKGGSAVAFLMEQERFAFPEAVRFLADRLGIPVPVARGEGKEAEGRLRLVEMHRMALEHFRGNLAGPAGAAARGYLASRELDAATIDRFQLGYALAQWDGLLRYLVRGGFRPEEIERAGLASPRREAQGGGARAGAYDRFRDRLMIPIADAGGKVIAFGGRALKADDVKYLNSPETPLYRKGDHLYGLSLASRAIREAGRAVLVEGYFDLISLHRAGVLNAVAALGTALTAQQVDLLARYTGRTVVAFDPDRAGLQAALRGIGLLLARGLAVDVATLPEGMDPDTLVIRRGRDGVNEVFSRTLDVVDFAWAAASRDRGLQPGASEEEPRGPGAVAGPAGGVDAAVRAGEAVLEVLARMDPGIRRDKYAQRLADRLGVTEARIQAELDRRGAGRGAAARPLPAPKTPGTPDDPRRTLTVEGELLQLLLFQPERAARARAVLAPEDFHDQHLGRIFALVCDSAPRGRMVLTQVLMEHPDAATRTTAAGLLMAEEEKFQEADRILEDFLKKLTELKMRADRSRLVQQMKVGRDAGDPQVVEQAKAAHPAWRRPAADIP